MWVPPQRSSGPETLDYEAVVESMTYLENTSRVRYTKFTDADHFQIRRYAGENGNKKSFIHLTNKFAGLTESIVRTLKNSTKTS